MRHTPWIAAAALSLAACTIGCWGDVVPIYPDGGADASTDTDTGPPAPVFFPGGGTGGGPIDGLVNVYFFDESTGEGIADARVMLGDDPETALTGTTDNDGLVVFEDTSLTGAVNLHVLAEGYSAESVIALAAANSSFAVRPSDFTGEQPEPASLTGTVSGFDNIPEPGAGEYKVVAVAYGRSAAATLDDRDPQLEPSYEVEVVQVDAVTQEFAIEAPPGTGVLYALGGLRVVNEDDGEVYEWTHLGLVTGLEPSAGGEIEDLEIELDISLLIEFRAYLSLLPSVYDVKRVALAVDLFEEGMVWLLGRPSASQTVFVAPGIEGELEDAGVFLMALGDQDTAAASDLLASTPRARRYELGLEEFFGYSLGPYIFDAVGSPPAQVSWNGSEFSCYPSSGTSLGTIVVQGAEDGVQSWRATVFGALPDTLSAPMFPVSWGWEGAPATGVVLRAWTSVVDADVNDLDFDTFYLVVRDTAENAALIE